MPRKDLWLGLLVFCIATPWIAAETVGNGTGKLEEESTTYLGDNTRRESPISTDDNNYPLSIIDEEHEENNLTEDSASKSFNTPKEELTGFEMEAPCDNAQFLMKILTVLLPLLRNEVPTSTRTSYILEVLKDLLKSSPEAAQDYEIMYKINDLLMALDKYHNNQEINSLDQSHSALRQLDGDVSLPGGVKSKIVFKYEVPHLGNPDCTAELLTIIKVVQEAILRLVNNPLCKFQVPVESSILVDVDKYLNNPNIHTIHLHDKQNLPIDQVLDTNDLDTVTIDNQNNVLVIPKYTYIEKNYDQLPFEQKPSDVYIEYPNGNKPTEQPYYYGASPGELSIINGHIVKPDYFPLSPEQPRSSSPILDIKLPMVDKDVIVKKPGDIYNKNPFDYLPNYDIAPSRPKTNPKSEILPMNPDTDLYVVDSSSSQPSLLDVFGDGSGEVQIKDNQPYPFYELDIPSNQQDVEVKFPSSPLPVLDFYGDDYSTEFQIGPHKSDRLNKRPKSLNPENLYIPYNPDVYTIPNQNPEKNPNKYDTSPQKRPFDRGESIRPKLPLNPFDAPDRDSDKSRPYNPYLADIEFIKPKPLDIFGGGSGEIQLSPTDTPTTSYFDVMIPAKSTSKPEYYEPRDEFPRYDWPKDNANENIINAIKFPDLYTPTENIVPELLPDGKQYLIPEIQIPYEEIPDSGEWSPDYEINQNNKPWNSYNIPKEILPQPKLAPENQILLIIRDNIDMMEQKIPSEYITSEIREMIIKLKHLLNTEQITIETYVNIINQYQILIEYVKNLNINNAIMKELLLSMTNLDKLNLLTGKSQVIELTYLIKRPKPLVYQPYYYIKYQLPYTSFLTRVERLLASKPYLKKDPSRLYKELISISKVTETSPDLENYGKKDILKLTFNKGTLVGAKVIKKTDLDMYNTLDILKRINTDLTIDEVYELIKKLDAQLKLTDESLVIKNSNIPNLNINAQPNAIQIMGVKHQPILQKITKITTNKMAADEILANLLNNMNVLRSNISEDLTEERSSQPQVDVNIDKLNESVPAIGRTRDIYDFDDLDNGIPLYQYEPVNHKFKIDSKKYLKDDDLNVYKYPNYYPENIGDSSYRFKTKPSDIGFDYSSLYPNPTQYDKMPSALKQSKWYGGNNKKYKKSKSYNYEPSDTDYIPLKTDNSDYYAADYSKLLNPAISQKISLPITQGKQSNTYLNPDNYKRDDSPQQYYFESGPSVINSDIINSPNAIKSHLLSHSKTYIDNVPVEHSKSYLVDKPYNGIQQHETSFSNPMKYNAENSKPFIDDPSHLNSNPYVANNNYLSQPHDTNLDTVSEVSNLNSSKNYKTKTLSQDNNPLTFSKNPYVDNNNYFSQPHDTNLDTALEVSDLNSAKYDKTKTLFKDNNPLTFSNDPYVGNNNFISQSYDANLGTISQVPNINVAKYDMTKTLSQDNLYPNNYNLVDSPNQSQLANTLQQYQTYTANNFVQNPANFNGNVQAVNQQFGLNSAGNFGAYYSQKLLANNMNGRYRYLIQKRLPYIYQFVRRPRLARPFLG